MNVIFFEKLAVNNAFPMYRKQCFSNMRITDVFGCELCYYHILQVHIHRPLFLEYALLYVNISYQQEPISRVNLNSNFVDSAINAL